LRADHLQCYGYSKDTAPFICSLASKGVLFTNAFSASSWTAPSIASLFTSLYPFQHNVTMGLAAQKKLIEKNKLISLTSLNDDVITLAEILRANGYQTIAISANPNISEDMGLHQGFDIIRSIRTKSASAIVSNCIEIKNKLFSHKPYFLYLHFMDVHSPYKIALPQHLLTNDPKENRIRNYDLEIQFVDENIKKLYSDLNWNKNTLIIITSDHGEELFDHSKTGHGYSLYKEVLHIPLIIFYPYFIHANKKIYHNVSSLDIYPTITNLINVSSGASLSGKSFLKLITNDYMSKTERYLFSHLKTIKMHSSSTEFFSVIFKNYHYINWQNQNMLFDMHLDPNEQNNIAKFKPNLVKQLASTYKIYKKKSKKYPPSYKSITLDEEQIKLLKSLGYIK
jgi:arylsulfatase A-like enzyme